MRVLVCGGRDFEDRATVDRVLCKLCDKFGLWREPDEYGNKLPGAIHIITGCCASGADALAVDWATINYVPCSGYPAWWSDISHPDSLIRTRRDGTKYDARAGTRRNQKMIDEGKPELVVAFPGGRGTADMVRRARAAGVKVIQVSSEDGDTVRFCQP